MPADPRDIIWLEAEQFADPGGWVHDAQFIDQMGSPYLLANGLGQPVADAVTRATILTSGAFRLWVRTKDWRPEHSPGLFEVHINGQCASSIFGRCAHPQWAWIDGGCFTLPAGAVEVRLHDLTGWWGRCDVIVLSADPDFRPADDAAALAEQRARYGGVSRDEQACGPFDVVVAGGGLAGTAAAVSAARHGCRVALLQDRPVLGGNGSTEIQVPVHGDETREPWDPQETGLIEEFDPRMAGGASWSANLESVVRTTPNLELFLDLHATGVEMHADGRIAAIRAVQVRSGQRLRFTGRLFIDCTGDASIGHWAGAEYRHGREARAEYGESLAPEQADAHTMGNTLFAGRLRKHAEPCAFEAPAWARQWQAPEDFEQRPMEGVWSTGRRPDHFHDLSAGKGRPPDRAGAPVGCWYVELGGMQDTVADAEAIRDELLRVSVGLWHYVKNHHPTYRAANANLELVHLNHIAGKRESRRLLGDYVLTQRDYVERIVHEDTVAYGGWTIDDHHPQGFFAPGPLAFHAYLQKVSIPYRCLYSRNVPNLMMAGRNISATHVAFGGTRVMRTCCQMGQAVGTAAAIAVREAVPPRGLCPEFIDELQQTLLRDGAYLLGVRNHDPADLARTASTVTATSSAANVVPECAVAPISKWGITHPLDMARAVMFRAREARIDTVALYLASQRSDLIELTVQLCRAADLGDFKSGEVVARGIGRVPPNAAGWVDFALRAPLGPGAFYYLALPATPGVRWELYTYHPPETLRGFNGPAWGALWGCYQFRLDPGGEPQPSQEPGGYDFAAENLLDGYNRAVNGWPCSWSPDPAAPLPQSIELTFPRAIVFNTAYVTFQLPQLAPAAYELHAGHSGQWQCLVHVENNRQRRCRHEFPPAHADAVRLTILERQPGAPVPLSPVCELRLYDRR